MRSTMYGTQLNPGNIIDFHIENLGKLVFGIYTKNLSEANPGFQGYLPNTASRDLFNYTDEERRKLISDLHVTMNALAYLKQVSNDFTPPLTETHIKALMNTPAIANTWPMIMEYKPLQNMSSNRRNLITSTLNEMHEARRVEMMHLQQEQNRITALMGAVTKRQRPVPEFESLKKEIDRIHAMIGHSRSEFESEAFRDFCTAIAQANDPELAFEQIYSYIVNNNKCMHGVWLVQLDKCKASKEEFNRFFGEYGYRPENTQSYRA